MLNQSLISNLHNIRGILFDVDGTVYHQNLLRSMMVVLFFLLNIHRPKELRKKAQIINVYRICQEKLRKIKNGTFDPLTEQINCTAKITGESQSYITEVITEWFELKPLLLLRFCRRRNLKSIFSELLRKGYILGVYSDYPAKEKIRALKLNHFFSMTLSAKDKEVDGFKPMTNGFVIAAKKMKLKPSEILYVGDRPDVDGKGAASAGMPVVILNGWLNNKKNQSYPIIRSLKELLKLKAPFEKSPC